MPADDRYREMFCRNIGLFSPDEQDRLKGATVLMAGLGGVGGVTAEVLARTGVGRLVIADPGEYELNNVNRQFPSTASTVGRNKADVVAEHLRRINPELGLEVVTEGVTRANAAKLVRGADVVVDSVELYALAERVHLHRAARERGLFVVTCPQVGFGSLLLVFDPRGLTLERFLGIPEDPKALATFKLPLERFAVGMLDRFPPEAVARIKEGKGYIPFVACASALSGALAASEAAFLITGKRKPVVVPEYLSLDMLTQQLKRASFKA